MVSGDSLLTTLAAAARVGLFSQELPVIRAQQNNATPAAARVSGCLTLDTDNDELVWRDAAGATKYAYRWPTGCVHDVSTRIARYSAQELSSMGFQLATTGMPNNIFL